MESLVRPQTNLDSALLFPLAGKHTGITQNLYLDKLQKFERKCEKSLIDTLSRLSIHASVKTDPYSLPYRDEVVVTLYGESYLNGAYEFHRVAKPVVKKMLELDAQKIRFYFFINVLPGPLMGKVEYRFRYYIHY